MPDAGSIKVTKKLRMMEFWAQPFSLVSFEHSYLDPYSIITGKYDSGETGSFNLDVTFGDGNCDATSYSEGTFGGNPVCTLTYKYHDNYTVRSSQHRLVLTGNTISINDLPDNATILHAYAMMRYGSIENDTGILSYLTTPSKFDFCDAPNQLLLDAVDRRRTVLTGLNMSDGSMRVPANGVSRGSMIVGNTDLKDIVYMNDTYYIQWTGAYMIGKIIVHNLQFGLRVYFK